MMNCDRLQPHDYLHVITIFSCLFCTFVGNIDKPLSPSSEWFWSLNSIRPTWNCYEKVMRQRSWCVSCLNRSEAHIQIGVSRGCWRSLVRIGRGELSHQRAQGVLFFNTLISPHQRSEWSIDPAGETVHHINNAPTLIHILQLSPVCKSDNISLKMVHLKEKYFHKCD